MNFFRKFPLLFLFCVIGKRIKLKNVGVYFFNIHVENWYFIRYMAAEGLYVNVQHPYQENDSLEVLRTSYYHMIVMVDLQCGNYTTLLQNVSKFLLTIKIFLLSMGNWNTRYCNTIKHLLLFLMCFPHILFLINLIFNRFRTTEVSCLVHHYF